MNPSNPHGKEEKTYSSTRPQTLCSSILTSLSEFPFKSNGRLKLKAVMPNITKIFLYCVAFKIFSKNKTGANIFQEHVPSNIFPRTEQVGIHSV